jgi:hypothetical protein
MKTFCNIVLFFLIITSSELLSQTIDSTVLNKYSSEIKKGDFAVTFDVGTIFGSSSRIESYTLSGKYHLSDKLSLRLEVSENAVEETSSDAIIGYNSHNYSHNIVLNMQYYFSKSRKIKGFLSAGPVYSYSGYGDQSQNYAENRYNWGLGLFASLGAEYFIIDNVSLSGEYVAKATLGKDHDQFMNDGGVLTEYVFDVKTLKANTIRFGLCVYF